MPTFSFDETLPTWLDYARARVDDLDPVDFYLSNETWQRLYDLFGPVEGLARGAGMIAVKIAQQITAFGEAAGVRFTKANLDYYEQLPQLIRGEPPFDPLADPTVRQKMILSGRLKAGRSTADLFVQSLLGMKDE
jgi:hypothetical protein